MVNKWVEYKLMMSQRRDQIIINIRYLKQRLAEFVLNKFRLMVMKIVFTSWFSSDVAMCRSIRCSAMQQVLNIWVLSIAENQV